MSYTVLAHVATGDVATATLQNALIDDLAVLKTSILDDGRLSGELRNFREDVITLSIVANVVTLDLSLSNNFKVSLTANITTITLTNWTAAKSTSVKLRMTQDGGGGKTVAFPAGWLWAGGSAPAVTVTASKTTTVILDSDDGGTTIFPTLYTINA